MKIVGISRSKCFSPNSEDRDKAIFDNVTLNLERSGYSVETYSEDYLPKISDSDFIFSMGRSLSTLSLLSTLEQNGCTIINSPSALCLLSRTKIRETCRLLEIKTSESLNPNGNITISSLVFPCWLKRNDACSQAANDVSFIRNLQELKEQIQLLESRGITDWSVSTHVAGDLIKFYGVAGTDFFFSYSPKQKDDFSKFGLEAHNDTYRGFDYDKALVKKNMDKLAEHLNVVVYGGDIIVERDGTCRLIDFNDWPSFSCCRESAAFAISNVIEKKLAEMQFTHQSLEFKKCLI